MRILSIGDLHFGEKGNSSHFNEQVLEFVNWCCDIIESENIDTVIQVGDWFHSRHKIDVSTLNYGIEGARRLSEVIGKENLYVMLGNHDLFYLERLDYNSVKSLQNYVTIVDKTTVIENDIMMTPWITGPEAWDALIDEVVNLNPNYVFGHFDFNGFTVNDGYVMDHGYNHKALKSASLVVSGHYHSSQSKDNVTYIGTPYPITMSEANEDHGPYILDTDIDVFKMITYDKVKVVSVSYDDVTDEYLDSLDPANTSIRIEFPDGFNDESYVKEMGDILSERNFQSVKIKHTSTTASEIMESDVGDVDSVENIDEVVLKFIKDSTQIEGVNKQRLEKFYKQAMETTND